MGFGGLAIANSGLRVAQRNLNVTGHNIANSETPGFSRQRIVQMTAFQRQVGVNAAGRMMQVGMGANWSEVHQIRNEFLDINFRNNVAQLNFYSTKVAAGRAIEAVLGELHGAYNFQSVINNMWYAIQELTAFPEGIASRQFFLATANTFLTKSQAVKQGLLEQQFNLDAQIREVVNGAQGVNATVARIGELNLQIRKAEAGGERANDWRDERHRLIDHLATLIPIDVFQAPNGDMNIMTHGHHLLTGNTQSLMGLRFIANEVSFVEPVFTQSRDILSAGTPPTEFTTFMNYLQPINAIQGNDRGKLMALMQARGTTIGNHLSADIAPPINLDDTREWADVIRDLLVPDLVTDYAGIASLSVSDVQDVITRQIRLIDHEILTNAALDETEIAELRDEQDLLRRISLNIGSDTNSFVLRYAIGDDLDILALDIERNFLAQMHNHNAHMWSLQHSMMPQVQMNLDRIINAMVTMMNDAVTGRLRGQDGNFIFYATDVDGNPILLYDLVYNVDGTPLMIPNPDAPPALIQATVPRIDPVTGEQMRQHRIPYTLNPRPSDLPADAPWPQEIPLFVREEDIDIVDGSVTVSPVWPISYHENPNRLATVFTANNIRINPDFLVAGGHNLLGLSMSGAPGDTDLLVALQQVWMSGTGHYSVQIGDRTFSVQDAYIRFTGDIASEINEAMNKVTTQTVTTDQAHNMRMAIKGVSMDEELNAMLRFQFAFQAASRVFNMIDQMIDRIVNGTGRVGL
jgi:flagellar hook-associated protein FlgK